MAKSRDMDTITEASRGQATLPALRVVARRSDGQTTRTVLGLRAVVVGAGEDADLVVDDARVSNRHCKLLLTSMGIVVLDCGSKNGTRIGDVAILEAVIPIGTHLTVGSSEVWVERAGGVETIPLSEEGRFGGAAGDSLVMRSLFATLEKTAQEKTTLLLLGETGTGKKLLARAVHDRSPRRLGPFVTLDGAAAKGEALSRQLFGSPDAPRGKLAEAATGTLFIDHCADLPLEEQATLAAALQSSGGFEGRLVAATDKDLKKLVQEGALRRDLYLILKVITVRVPPLRDRREDIPLLVEAIVSTLQPALGGASIRPEILPMLERYDWPGNVRELRNVVEQLLVLPDEPPDLEGAPAAGPLPDDAPWGADLVALKWSEAKEEALRRFGRFYVQKVLEECGNNVTRTARRMGIERPSAHALIKKFLSSMSPPVDGDL